MPRPPAARAPIIADVARVAGVSVPTVSRVLTGSTPVSPEKRERILQAIRELGYRPNAAARALVSGRQSMIAIITESTTRYGYAMTIQGIEEAARAAGYIVVITVVDAPDEASVSATIDLVLGQPVAGVVVISFDSTGELAAAQFPVGVPKILVVSVGDDQAVEPQAAFDSRGAAREATNYLLGLGHQMVHQVSVPQEAPRTGRTRGWEDALHAAGLDIPDVIPVTMDPASGREAGLALARRADVTAVMCWNDVVALGVIRGLHEAGRRVPADVSVVGFDDIPLAAVSIPALTTVAHDFTGLGHRAFAQLNTIITTGELPVVATVAPHLVIRESAAPPRR